MAKYIVVSEGFHNMKEKKFEISESEFDWLDGVRRNDAHGGKLVAADVYEMGGKIAEKVQKYLCGMKDCTCGGNGKAELQEIATSDEILSNINGNGGFHNINHWNRKEISEYIKNNFNCSSYVAKKVAEKLS